MKSTFRCIRCDKHVPAEMSTDEHVIPYSLGGSLIMRDLCKPCNDVFGHSYDSTLTDNMFVQFRRRRLRLHGRSGDLPDPISSVGSLADDPSVRARIERGSGLRILPSKKIEEGPGRRQETLVFDARDVEMLALAQEKQQERMRRRFPTALFEQNIKSMQVPSASINLEFQMPAHDWLLGVTKIVYELSYLFIGAAYLDDPLAQRFRAFLQNKQPTVDLLADSGLPLSPCPIGGLDPIEGLSEGEHYGAIFRCPRGIGCEVRLFEFFGINAIVSETPDVYPQFVTGVGGAIVFDAAKRQHWRAV